MNVNDKYLSVDKNGSWLAPDTKFDESAEGWLYGSQLITYNVTSRKITGYYYCCPAGDISTGLEADKAPIWYSLKS